MPREKSEADKLLLCQFLEAGEDYDNEELGEVLDLTGERVRQYKAGEWTYIPKKTRKKMEEFIGARGEGGYVKGRAEALLEIRRSLDEKISSLLQVSPEVTADLGEEALEELRKLRADEGTGGG